MTQEELLSFVAIIFMMVMTLYVTGVLRSHTFIRCDQV